MTRCPRCGAANGCAMAADASVAVPVADAGAPCWCAGVSVDPARLAGLRALPGAAGGGCFCRACLGGDPAAQEAGTASAGVASAAVVR